MLGVGEDGHVASIFPNHQSVATSDFGYIKVTKAPKPPSDRVSITPSVILFAKTIFLFFIGKSKRQAYDEFLYINTKLEDCPAKITLESKADKIYIYQDVKLD